MASAVQSLQPVGLYPVSAPVPAAAPPGLRPPLACPSASCPPVAGDTLRLKAAAGDARVPAQPLSLFSAPAGLDPIAAGKLNSTQGFKKGHMPVSTRQALDPTIKIVEAVAPEIGKAMRKLDDGDFELAADGMQDVFAKHDIYAAWVAVARERGTARLHFSDMILDDRFWELRDAEKASILIHEMVHAGETPIISHFEKLFGTIYNKVKGIEWGDPVEDRAYVYQYGLFDKLGITKADEVFWAVETYLEDRKLIAPVQP
ncbi:MAG: hypothetical protein ACAI44_15260 [Candidatus Sericytochromatia bacterium]